MWIGVLFVWYSAEHLIFALPYLSDLDPKIDILTGRVNSKSNEDDQRMALEHLPPLMGNFMRSVLYLIRKKYTKKETQFYLCPVDMLLYSMWR